MCEPVAAVDDSVRKIVQDLVDTLYSTTGVGLAAPQIGVNKRVFIYDPFRSGDDRHYKVLLNPRITHREGTTISAGEGCKSAPDLRLDVERSAIIDIEGMDETGAPVFFRAEGLEAIVLQHEMDHLEGKLITHQLAPEECASYERPLAISALNREPWYVSNLRRSVNGFGQWLCSRKGCYSRSGKRIIRFSSSRMDHRYICTFPSPAVTSRISM
jgi:peptide deformylase